jgi:aryl-alcohol dehydrogenase-like predicted oxidoreductase
MLAIPGTTRLEHLLDNLGASSVTLQADIALRAAACMSGIQGARYAPATFAEIDSD